LRIGVHKAPANEILEGVVDLEVNLTHDQQGPLNVRGINCLRAFPGRGIRIWGARTLSSDIFWRYVNVRRLFLTVGRWIERNMADVLFEPQSLGLWAHIVRDLSVYLEELFRRGALKGESPQEAFYVKCDAELNPPEVQAEGIVITEIGLAAAVPAEFIVVRLIHGPAGLRIIGPS
jgi:phage tail sheath protein FI